MKTKCFLLIVLLFSVCTLAKAQTFEVPQNYEFNTQADFRKYEPDLIKAVSWFEQTPYNEQRLKRVDVAAFIMTWIQRCPYVTVETSEGINELGDKNNDLLVTYLAGYARFVLQGHMLGAQTGARMAGMKALFAKYEKDKLIIRDKRVEKLIKLDQEGGLQAWLSDELNSK
ncbi:hypothetical protein BDD43_5700 [Mucilaginibacter gracilis]|uniref:Uncharacterized protein n=1 Tax=Mucilaginibacter gracilis TaxID=423350 RepID=A0A495JBI8_9SPHI|nr:hypothetical protein [Mucilaginibacter gracilis]RKR85429.1 hypothetical protein BDD43_5700 [Mucilaginibacter gracilis]